MVMFHEDRSWRAWAVRFAIFALALGTAYIHYILGGLLFLANAAGYLGFALLMIAPLEIASRYRWLIRAGLVGFTVGTIVAWQLFGARFWLGYFDKAIEIALVAALGIEMVRYDGGPLAVARRAWRLAADGAQRLTRPFVSVLSIAVALVLVVGCGTARPFITAPPNAVIVSAAGDSFTNQWVSAPVGDPFTIYFQITDFRQHNIRVWDGNDSIAATEIFGGPSARILEVPAIDRGNDYSALRLTCDIHPDMWAQLEAW